jgi:transcriptional regulator with XRE-family HTH domain
MYPNLKLQLWTSGIRQNRLAHMLGMDEAALSKIINGYREPGAELRRFIAKILEGDEEWLFQRVDRDAERNVSRGNVKAAGGESSS